MENMKTKRNFTKKDLRKISKKWILGSQITWNYEKMMAPGYLYAILPALEKLYTDKDELTTMMKNHIQFFNTTPHMGGFILGIDIATEELEGVSSKDTINGLKTGLMGPFAGIGDTIFGVLLPTIFGSIAAYMAQQGNVMGVIIWLLANILILVARYFFVEIGYNQGVKLMSQAKDRLDAITQAATILGITVVGALIPTVVRADVVTEFQSGEVVMNGQEILDQIMPALIPTLIVGLVYYLLGKKNMTSTKVTLFIMGLSILFYIIGFLG